MPFYNRLSVEWLHWVLYKYTIFVCRLGPCSTVVLVGASCNNIQIALSYGGSLLLKQVKPFSCGGLRKWQPMGISQRCNLIFFSDFFVYIFPILCCNSSQVFIVSFVLVLFSSRVLVHFSFVTLLYKKVPIASNGGERTIRMKNAWEPYPIEGCSA